MPEPTDSRQDVSAVETPLRDRVVKGSIWTLLALGINLPVGIVANILLARLLGIANYGQLAALTLIFAVAGVICDLGMSSSILQFGITAQSQSRHELTDLLGKAQGLRLFITLPATLLLCTIIFHDNLIALIVIAMSMTTTSLLTGATNIYQIRNLTAITSRISIVQSVIVNLGMIVYATYSTNVKQLIALRAALSLASCIFLLLRLNSSDRRMVLQVGRPTHFPDGFWAFSLPTWTATLIGVLVFSRSEVVILHWYGYAEAAGLFALAFGLSQQLTAPLDSLSPVLLAALSSRRAEATNLMIRDLTRSIRLFSTLAVATIPIAVLAAFMIPTVFGPQYATAGEWLLPIACASILQSLAHPIQAFLFASRASKEILASNLIALFVDATLLVTLIPVLGGWAAVAANVTAQVASLTLLTVSCAHKADMHPLQLALAGRLTLIALASTLLPALALWEFWSNASKVSIAQAVGATLASIGIIIATSHLMKPPKQSRHLEVLATNLPSRMQQPMRLYLRSINSW